MLIESLIAALIPVGVEGVKQAINHFSGGVKPTTVDEQIKLDQNEIERIKAVATLDNPGGTPSQWVIDLRASARYIGALAVIAVGIGSLYIGVVPANVQIVALEAANIAFGFLFGQRIAVSIGKK
jgi:hypothetical protein